MLRGVAKPNDDANVAIDCDQVEGSMVSLMTGAYDCSMAVTVTAPIAVAVITTYVDVNYH